MSDQMDSTPSAADSQSLPDSGTSSGKEGQPHSEGLTELPVSLVLKALEDPNVRTAVGKILQSEKDRGVHKAVKDAEEAKETVQGLRDELAKLEKYLPDSVSLEDLRRAQDQLEMDEMKEWYRERASRGKSQGSDLNVSKAVQDIGDSFGIDWDDPGVKDWLVKNPDPNIAAFAAYAAERKYTSPPGSPAGISAPASSAPPRKEFADMTSDQMGAEIERLMIEDARGSKEMRKRLAAEIERRDKSKK